MSDAKPRQSTLSVGLVSLHQSLALPAADANAIDSAADSEVRLHFAVGSVLAGKYRLERALGVGGMGAVWVALNTMTDAEVALKVLHEEVENPEALTRFRREAHLAAKLSHRGIVRVFDLVELKAGTLAMVMEILRGETLAERLDRDRIIPPNEAIDIALCVASALAHAHSLGVVHRDLKPENVFLCREPDGKIEPKILDFGISKMTGPAVTNLTGDGTLLGTPGYMSPEQARGDEVDGRSDLFALGILLYEMISGDNPFTASTYNAVIAAILERDPEPLPQVSPEVWAVLQRVFEKRRAKRYASVADFAVALRNAAGIPVGSTSLNEINTGSMRGLPAATPDTFLSGAAPASDGSASSALSSTQPERLSASVLPRTSNPLLAGLALAFLAAVGAGAAALHSHSSNATPASAATSASVALAGPVVAYGTGATTSPMPPKGSAPPIGSLAATAPLASSSAGPAPPASANAPTAATAASVANAAAPDPSKRTAGGAATTSNLAANTGPRVTVPSSLTQGSQATSVTARNGAPSSNGASGAAAASSQAPPERTDSPVTNPQTPATAPGVRTMKNPGF